MTYDPICVGVRMSRCWRERRVRDLEIRKSGYHARARVKAVEFSSSFRMLADAVAWVIARAGQTLTLVACLSSAHYYNKYDLVVQCVDEASSSVSSMHLKFHTQSECCGELTSAAPSTPEKSQ